MYKATELDIDGQPLITFGNHGNVSASYPNANDIQTYEGFVVFPDESSLFLVSTRLVKLNATGFDSAFGSGGYLELGAKAWSVTAAPDHKSIYVLSDADGSLQRRDLTGALDATFATGGISAAGVVASQGARVRVQSDGRILTMGSGTITRFWN